MAYKTKFWSPLAVTLPLAAPLFTAIYAFGNWGGEAHGDDFELVSIIPAPLRPLYYLAAAITVAAVALIVSPLLFVLGLPIALIHDAFVKIGELFGCCEIENTPNPS